MTCLARMYFWKRKLNGDDEAAAFLQDVAPVSDHSPKLWKDHFQAAFSNMAQFNTLGVYDDERSNENFVNMDLE